MTVVSVFALIQPVLAAPEPTLTNGSATDITTTTATLTATISNAGDSPITSRGFNYGATNSYGDTTNEVVPESFDYVSKFGSAPNRDGELFNPYGVAVDSSGDVYVADTTNRRIQKFNSSGVYQSQFGTQGSGDGQFETPRAIAIDSADNIYVADPYFHRIQKFNSSGVYQLQFGGGGTGNGQFNHPYALAVDSSNNVYVSDRYNRRIQKFNSSGVYQSQFGRPGTGNGQFNQPGAMAFDSGGNVFVVDQGNDRIQKFNSSGVYQSQFGSPGTGNGQFSYPIGISIDNLDNSYVLERGNNRIQKFNSSGVYQSQFGTQGSGDGQFSYPQGIAIDNAGSMYVSDGEDHRVEKFNSSGVFQLQFGQGVNNDQLYYPASIAANSSNQILVLDTDNHQVNIFNSSGVYQSQFGSYGSGDGQLDHPYGLAVDSVGNIYVADTQNSRIQKFNSSGVYQSQFGSYGTSGNGKLNWPTALSVDSTGNIYVVDSNNHRIQKFNSSGVYQSQFGTQGSGDGQFSYPNGIAIDTADNIYIADSLNHRIQKFNSSGVYQSQFGTHGSGDGQFNYPQAIVIDSTGNILVTDQGNGRLQKFNSSGVYQSQFGIAGSGDGALYQPRSISVDSLGAVYTINGSGSSEVKKYVKSMHVGDFSANLTGLTCNTTYHYQAYAYNDNGLAQGADATFTTLACPVLEPGPPTNLSATAGSATTINVTWNEPSSTGDSLIANYIIYYKKVSDASWLSINTPDSSTTYTLNGMEPGTEYAIKIVARNVNNHNSVDSSQATVSTDVYVSPLPDPPTNLQATIGSTTSIDVAWDAPVHTGDSTISKYYIYYQKVGDSSWEVLDSGNDGTAATITGLRPSTQYNLKVVAQNTNGNSSADSNIISATTGTPGFYLISSCQQLQDIQNDLAGNYELARNIDCSDTINWNSGAGFRPIASLLEGTSFSGILAGNNYTINDLYIHLSSIDFAFAAPFAATKGALIQDVRMVRPNISFSNAQIGVVAGLIAYSESQDTTGTSVNNVHIIDASLQAQGEQFSYAGGIIGIALDAGTTTDSRNEFRGTIDTHGSMAGAIASGGLYGVLEGGTRNVDNSYASANINIDNTFPGESAYTVAGGLLGGNGLVENAPTQTNFNHSYSDGSITHNSAQPSGFVALGGAIGLINKELSIRNSFAHNALASLQTGVIEKVGGIIGAVSSPDVPAHSNSYFDADQANTSNCIDPSIGVMTDCTVIEGHPTYFYNNSTNAPLNTWDFDNIWQTTNTLPIFGKKALTGITAIPQSRLNSTTPPVGSARSITELTQKLKDSQTITKPGDQKTTTTPQGEDGIIGAIKRFLKNLPEAVVIGFPYVLFSLLLLAAGAMLIQVVINSRRLQATKLLIAKQRAVAEERDTFWHLAANYLRAPITLMVGGVELLSTDKDIRLPAVAQLETFTKNLQKKVFAIMSRIEQSRTLQDIHWPELENSRRVLNQLKFWLPIGLVASFAVLMNLVAKNYRNISVSSTNLAIQLLIFILVSILFYWVLSALGLVTRKRKQAETLLEQQSATLDAARTEFIEQSATTLDNDLSALESQLDSLPANAASMSIVREGAHRLRTLINSFELLVAAQNDKLNTLSPSSSYTQLNTIFDSVIASLNPLIAQKHIRVIKPDFGRVTLPGNSLLLNQVIGSVLSNAVAFSPVGSTIEISLKSHKGDVQLSVTNQGKIIDENQLSQVFRPFMKADGYNALQLDHGGLGVNLYIDSLIMRHLSGAIKVTSNPNKGTTMTMRWPITQTATAS